MTDLDSSDRKSSFANRASMESVNKRAPKDAELLRDTSMSRQFGVASILTGNNDQKKQRLILWPEWNENDINAEKWEVGGKSKDTAKAKPTSAAPTSVSHGFDDPDPKFEYPNGIHIRTDSFKRPSELFEKTPFIVDTENGLENFDLITPNEHLHNNEVMRWIISQIHTLWDICKKEPKSSYSTTPSQMLEADNIANKALNAGRLWRPWEHIYAINKVVKGPFIPAYNSYGKYIVRLYFMGTWRKILVDDLIPVDEKGVILLPVTSIQGEIWPMILTKALLKIISLDFNPSDSSTEFNDQSIIACFTGWLPEPLPLRFGHISEVWKFLKETLPKYQWPEDKPKTVLEDEMALINEVSDTKEDLDNAASKLDSKSQKSKGKEIKNNLPSGKDTKLDKHKKGEVKGEKKGKSIFDDSTQEESFSLDFPDMVVYASFTDLPLNKLSASTEVADRRERLRKYNLNHDFSNPVWITCTRDISLNPPPPPEKLPVWKTIRQKKKHVVPSDEPIPIEIAKPDQWIELKSPYVGYKASSTVLHPTVRSNSRYSKIRSRPQSQTNIEGIEEADEAIGNLEKLDSLSPSDLNRIKIDMAGEKQDSENSSRLARTSLIKGNSTLSRKDQENTQTELKPPGSIISSAKDLNNRSNKPADPKVPRAGSSLDKNEEELKSMRGSKLANDDLADSNNVAPGANEKQQSNETKSLENRNKLWMDFDDFFICFKSIIVYHKPTSYKFNEKYSDLRQVVPLKEKLDKKKDAGAAQIQLAPLFDEKSLKLLFVDSLMPIELIISFSSLSRWYEQKLDISSEKVSKSFKKSESVIQEHDTISFSETAREILPLQHGCLMAEPYTWKSLVTGQPSLRIHTTAIRSSFLSLSPGRHVLKFVISAPVGYHINVLSNTKFSLGDEEEIMPKLTDESCRFVDQALHIVKCLSDAIRSFSDPLRQKDAIELLYSSMSPLTDSYLNSDEDNEEETSRNVSKRNLNEIFHASLYEMLRKALSESADYEITFSWRVFLADATTSDPFCLKERRPETSSTSRGSAKKIDKKKSELSTGKESVKPGDKQSSANLVNERPELSDDKIEYWKNHTPTAAEHIAAVKIQTALRSFYVRQIFQSRIPGSPKNIHATEILRKSLSIVELNIHENALYLFRTMFKINPSIIEYYSFYKDEWNRISYLDYNGSYPDQSTNNWLILFRDVFYAHEQVLLLPKLYCNLNNCLLRVINNDTYKEIPKVFNKVSPYTYSKNKKGYTIIAESRAMDQPAGRWRLRLIGSSSSLIAPKANKTDVISAFDMKETRDYYVPNDKKTILRCKVTVSEDHLTTLQINTSKSDVYIKFTIYDNGEEVLSVTGKGTALIPVFLFLKDREDGTVQEQPTSSRPASKTFSTKSKAAESKGKESKGKRSSSVNSNENKDKTNLSRSSSRQSIGPDMDDDEQNKPHKYIIEAVVQKDSWPLSPSNWAFVNKLKEDEINDLKIFKDRANSPSKDNKQASDQKNVDKKGSKPKDKDKEKAKNPKGTTPAVPSRPASSSFDITKPHWTLKWVSDESTSDQIEIKKDTDRAEEIKALKRAWENVEAGRAAKAAIARSNFLKSNLIKADGTPYTEEDTEKVQADEELQSKVLEQMQASIKPKQSVSQPVANKNDDQPKASITVKSRKKDPSIKPILETEVKSSQDLNKIEDTFNMTNAADEILLSRPPTPPKPKVFLPPIDVAPFIKATNNGFVVKKDDNFIKEQDKQRKQEVNSFILLKDQMLKFREEERKYRLFQKLKQIEECEALQSKLDMSRKEIIEPREAFRQLFLDAERKRLEDLANQEASMASQNQKPDSKDKKKGSADKSGKKKK